MKKDVLAAVQTRRPAGDHYAFIKTRSRLRNRSRGQIEIDIVGDEEIKFAVTVVVDESAAGVPALAVPGYARFVGYIDKRSITIVVIKDILAEVTDEEIFEAVVIVIADANTLPPSGVGYACLQCYVGEC